MSPWDLLQLLQKHWRYHREVFHPHPAIRIPKEKQSATCLCMNERTSWKEKFIESRFTNRQIFLRRKYLPDQDYQQKGLHPHPSSSCLGKPETRKKKEEEVEVNSSINYAENSPAQRWTWSQLVCAELQRRILKLQVFDMYWWKWNHTHLIYPDWLPI